MTQKEKLMDLFAATFLEYEDADVISDYLLANGVVVLVDEPKNPPCWTCDHGWGRAWTGGYQDCRDSCEELRAYNSQLIAQEEAEAALKKMEGEK